MLSARDNVLYLPNQKSFNDVKNEIVQRRSVSLTPLTPLGSSRQTVGYKIQISAIGIYFKM